MKKNKILLVTGIADTFFSSTSDRKLEYGTDLVDKITNVIKKTGNDKTYTGIINLINQQDSNKSVDVTKVIKNKLKIIQYKLFNTSLFDVWNTFELKTKESDLLGFNAKAFDWIFPPSKTEIHICGVDINGFYKEIIEELLSKGYVVYLYSDLIKRFKNTESQIRSINNKNFEYCSYKSIKT